MPSADLPEPESGDLPFNIGYATRQSRTEYGVMEDRRSKGLGFLLVKTTEDREYADRLVAEKSDYPRFMRTRLVDYFPWREMSTTPGSRASGDES